MVTHLAAVSPLSLFFFFSNGILLLRETPWPESASTSPYSSTSQPCQFFFTIIWIPNTSLYFQHAHDMASFDLTPSHAVSQAFSCSWVRCSSVINHTTMESCLSTTCLNIECPSKCTLKSYAFSKFSLSLCPAHTHWVL